jgi:cell division protease FtsH
VVRGVDHRAGRLVSFMVMEEGLYERNVVAKVLSDLDGRARTDRLLKEAKLAVREQLDLHRPLVEALRDALLEREELIGDEILESCARPRPAWPCPCRLASRPAPAGELADPGQAG